VSILVSLADFERVLGPHAAAVGLPGRRLWDIFLQKVWGVDSLHALHEFLDRRHALLARSKEEEAKAQAEAEATNDNAAAGDEQDQAQQVQPPPPEAPVRLAPNSPFGAFMRRAVVEFRRLRFQDACELWNQFVRYRQPTAQQYWRRRNAATATALGLRLSFDNVLVEGQHEWGDEAAPALAAVAYGGALPGEEDWGGRVGGLPVSFDDVEMLLEFQVDQMQSKLPLSLCSSDARD
jgi:anaphase-promoting complex subunit 5